MQYQIDIDTLRAGNWFVDKFEGNYCVIRQTIPRLVVDKFIGKPYNSSISRLKPIPIAENNLSLAGFKCVSPHYEKYLPNGGTAILVHTGDGEYSFLWNEEYIINIYYVHDLQNVYFSCTGEELSLNLCGI